MGAGDNSNPFMNPQDEHQYVDTNPFNPDGMDEAPPPPYESVVMDTAVQGVSGEVPSVGAPARQVPAAQPSPFHIEVKDPVKHGEGVSAHVSYKVATRTTLSQYKSREMEVIRRFRDFAWLHQQLQDQNRGIIVPPVPEKNAVQKFQMTHDFIEQRRLALQSFINRVASHPSLQQSRDLQMFLEASEDEFAHEVARAQVESGAVGAKGKLASTLQMFRDLGQSTANLMSGRHGDEDEDPDYLKVRDYMFLLESHLTEVHRQAARLIERQVKLGASMSEFGASMVALGKFESGTLADQFMHMGERTDSLALSCQRHSHQLEVNFEAPLKEFVRMVKSAKNVMQDRSTALTTLQQAKVDADTKRTKLAKLRGTPGIKESTVALTERELRDAQHKVEEAKSTYQLIVQRMTEELSRFQQERASELASVLRNFAVAQAQLAAENAKMWRSLVSADQANGLH